MRLYRRLLLKEFIPYFLLGLLFFTLILLLADIFSNLWRYLNEDVPFSKAILVSLFYVPTAMAYALPIGSMFAGAFSLGNIGARNELIAIFGSGVRLIRFVRPMLFLAAFLSVAAFILDDKFAIPFTKRRTILSKELLNIEDIRDRAGAIAIVEGGKVIYFADYYSDEQMLLTGVTIIRLNDDGGFRTRLDAGVAEWQSSKEDAGTGKWLLKDCRIYNEESNGDISQRNLLSYTADWINEKPETFRLDTRKLKEMNAVDAWSWIENQKRAGLPYRKHQSEYFQRFTTALTPFLVVFFSGALAGRFKRNILLMSLLASLGLSSAWYIARLVFTLLSEAGFLLPLTGAIIPYVVFLFIALYLFRTTRT